jgi:hypothetical protein
MKDPRVSCMGFGGRGGEGCAGGLGGMAISLFSVIEGVAVVVVLGYSLAQTNF